MIKLMWGALCNEGFPVIVDVTLGGQLFRAQVMQDVRKEVARAIDAGPPVLSRHLLIF